MLDKSYEKNRCRGFSCSDKLWERLVESCNNAISVSTFIRMAVEEKLERF